ncbi:MAG: bifunctional aspartate kinase/homoserine dehydrogenase I, partial [Deltaproteobacteria bacterium]|nr:bifunctional aspartate kinase/homoserine dehydrogenase I [Deltaproteobacteria bacterium]
AGPERYRHVAGLVRSQQTPGGRTAVVVSAMAKVTDALFDCCARAAQGADADDALDAVIHRHHGCIDALVADLGAERAAALKTAIDDDTRGIRSLLGAVRMMGSRVDVIDEVVAGHGEVWSAQILAAVLGVPWLDARKCLIVEAGAQPVVDETESRRRTRAFVDPPDGPPVGLVVITGYVATTRDGRPTTLKRNGSDFSASIFGALLDAREVVIWTDVDGVLSADPRRVPEAVLLDEMSYAEAMELAYFGAKVVHPRTMQPAVDQKIPIWIKNTFRPNVKGTVIHAVPPRTEDDPRPPAPAVKGFTTIDGIALLNLEGTGMVGVPGVAERLFGALRQAGVSVVVISQASSEHSICFAIPDAQVAMAKRAVDDVFAAERAQGLVADLAVVTGCSVLAAVGDAMAEQPGVAARFFGALGDVGVNIKAVAQGSSERNITAIIDGRDSTRALRAVHARFTLSDLTLSVGVVGTGLIGKAFLAQLEQQRDELRRRYKVDLRVRAVANSRSMVLHDSRAAVDALAEGGVPLSLDALAAHVRADHLPHAVIVDCTAGDTVVDAYAGWLRRGIHVITPNKRAASGPLPRWRAIQAAARAGHARYFGEATVGAGLPVITTLKDLRNTGDTVVAVEGVLSGTLSWIFNTLAPGESFSERVREARRLGYTEPDPREDLSGLDFARKLVVLAREMGRDVSLEDVDVEDLAPGAPFGAPLDALLASLQGVDRAITARQQAAQSAGQVLRMVGVVPETGRPSVRLLALPLTHPFARLDGSDNILAFRTRRYATGPLVVQGPGAGPEVTAGGVFGDLLRVVSHLGGA